MSSIAGLMQETRLKLAEPRAQKPSGRAVLKAVLEQTQNFINELNNTGQAWAVDQYYLNVRSNTSDYLLAVESSFGKPLQVLTYYPANQSFIETYVELFALNDLNNHWGLPNNVASWTFNNQGAPNTAMRMGFYRQQGTGDVWVRVKPMPMLSATYIILYQIGDYATNVGLQDNPLLSQFHSLIETRAAQSLLPHAEWSDDPKRNERMQEGLAKSLQNDRSILEADFGRYIGNQVTEHLTTRHSSFDAYWQ